MKKSVVIIIVVVIVVIAVAAFLVAKYNGLVKLEESVTTAWSNVEGQYQRRADLIPNLVNTVKGYAEHESETLQEVVEARGKATSINIEADELNEESIAQYQAAQSELSSALGRLIAISESYPDLKANENFRDLQVQLEGTENRIAESRRAYNETVQTYNVKVRSFPTNIVASLFGFEKKVQFKAEAGTEKAPTVEF